MEGPGGNMHGIPQRSIFSGVYTADWPEASEVGHGREIDELTGPLGGPPMDHYTIYGAARNSASIEQRVGSALVLAATLSLC